MSIHTLPEEVLSQIFAFLDAESLKNCCLTQSSWNDIIGAHSKTMKKFQLNLTEKTLITSEIENILNLKRKVYAIRIHQPWEDLANRQAEFFLFFDNVKKVIEIHGLHVRCFKVECSPTLAIDHFLKLMPRLESLEICESWIHAPMTIEFTLPHLKHLKVVNNNFREEMVKILQAAPNVTRIEWLHKELGEDPNFLNSILRLRALESLVITTSRAFFNTENIAHVPFKLRKLGIVNEYEDVTTTDYFGRFLQLQGDSLVDLTLNCRNLSEDCYQQIFSQFKKLKNLDINASFFPIDITFFPILSPMENVKYLKIRGSFRNREICKLFFQVFPNVETLDIMSMHSKVWTCAFFNVISKFQKNLRHLKTSGFYTGTHSTLQFLHLKSLTVSRIFETKYWINFITDHRDLETVIVGNVISRKISQEHMKKLLDHPALRHLEFEGSAEAIRDIGLSIKRIIQQGFRYTNLQTLLFKFGPSKVTIRFPAESALWKADRYENLFPPEGKKSRKQNKLKALN